MQLSPLTLRFIETHPGSAAAVLEKAPRADQAALVAALPPAVAARLIACLLPTVAAHCLKTIDPDAAAALVHRMPVDTAAALLGRLEENRRKQIVGRLKPASALPLRLLLRYPTGSVGSIVNPAAMTVRRQMRAGEVARRARRARRQLRKYLYVLDDEQRLIGTVDARACLLAGRDTEVDALMQTDPIALRARSSLVEIRDHAAWGRFDLLPVVDRSKHFLGVVRRADVAGALGLDAGQRDAGLADTLVSLADLYWQAMAALLAGAGGQVGENQHDQ